MQASPTYTPIQEGLARVEENLKRVSSPQFQFLAQLLDHVIDTSGKMVRPAITLLASNFHPSDGKNVEAMATAVELLHIAALIHDDTVDSSDFRRGRATISSLWGRNVAVLVGDYLFALSATFVCETGNISVIRRFAETIMDLSSGELQEIADTYNPHLTMDDYLKRIYNKTASLFSTAGESGAILSGAPDDVVCALKEYSSNIGLAYQIVDDILDFEGAEEEVGKPVGRDLSHGIMTPPAMIAMERFPEHNPIPSLFQRPHDEMYLKRSVEMIQNSSVIEDSYSMAREFCRKAGDALKDLPATPSRDSLQELVDYVPARRR